MVIFILSSYAQFFCQHSVHEKQRHEQQERVKPLSANSFSFYPVLSSCSVAKSGAKLVYDSGLLSAAILASDPCNG